MPEQNFQVILKSRPGADSEPRKDNFGYEECPMPEEILQEGEIMLKTCYLSVDPAMRCLMNEDSGVTYADAWQLHEVILGFLGVGVVMKSNHKNYEEGDLVTGTWGWSWKLYFTKNIVGSETNWEKVDKSIASRPSLALHFFTGMTSLLGIWEKGHISHGSNQTFVVSGAAGACGSQAGQMARLEGCTNVVGICGSREKCDWLVNELGFDAAINYKIDDVSQKLAEYCSNGIDVYFDNVGGSISDQVIGKMNTDSHVILCGQISQYNKDLPYPPPLPDETQKLIDERHITRERYTVVNYPSRFEEAGKQFTEWVLSGKLQVRETVTEGLEHAGEAFLSMMKGGNIGKQLVHVADP